MARQQGNITIEFAVTFLPFFVMVLVVIETCRFMMTGNMLDVALATATRKTVHVNDHENVVRSMQAVLAKQDFPMVDSSRLQIEATYYDSLEALKNNVGSSTYTRQPFAEYSVSYPYQVLLIDGWAEGFDRLTTFERKMLVAHERS
ncbi:TadE/TadG family type IV pilus assembly protein [Photobacterium alginatilyticum]|nr:TadE/TadG family type IV pilus assembly protein [Photobacterium alginatilyticum]